MRGPEILELVVLSLSSEGGREEPEFESAFRCRNHETNGLGDIFRVEAFIVYNEQLDGRAQELAEETVRRVWISAEAASLIPQLLQKSTTA